MKPNSATPEVDPSDADLVNLSLTGNREAFGSIVARHQSLVCSLAYSAVGNLAQSEELAQETFVAAWRQLPGLREPAKLRGWLCGIVRNLSHSSRRQQVRDPIHAAEPLENAAVIGSPEPSPLAQAIRQDEEAVMWRALALVPETYREPLVLFYRQHQSVASVAAALELSEDAVKMRLSRGRQLLHEQVLSLIEVSLSRTNPGAVFTTNVLATLPTLAAAGASAATGGVAVKAASSAGYFMSFLGPLAGLFGGAVGTKLAMESTISPRERTFIRRSWAAMWAGALLYWAGAYLVSRSDWQAHPRLLIVGLVASVFCYGALQGLFVGWVCRRQRRIRSEDMQEPSHPMFGLQRYEYRSRATLFGMPLLHVRFGPDETGRKMPAKGWIAMGETAYGAVFACGAVAIAPVSFGALAIGGFAWGGFGIGILAFGGMSLGVAATGGGAIGYIAWGGAAIGWLGAAGGAAVAHHFALGGGALAEHANDPAAVAFMQNSLFFRHAESFTWIMIQLSWLSMAGPAIFAYRLRRRRRSIVGPAPVLPAP